MNIAEFGMSGGPHMMHDRLWDVEYVARLISPKLIGGFYYTHLIQYKVLGFTQCVYGLPSLGGTMILFNGTFNPVAPFPQVPVFPD